MRPLKNTKEQRLSDSGHEVPIILSVHYRLRAEFGGGATAKLLIGARSVSDLFNDDSDQPEHAGWYLDRRKGSERGTLERVIGWALRKEGYLHDA